MSLAFALMAAINGSQASAPRCRTGSIRTKPRRRQPGGRRILTLQK